MSNRKKKEEERRRLGSLVRQMRPGDIGSLVAGGGGGGKKPPRLPAPTPVPAYMPEPTPKPTNMAAGEELGIQRDLEPGEALYESDGEGNYRLSRAARRVVRNRQRERDRQPGQRGYGVVATPPPAPAPAPPPDEFLNRALEREFPEPEQQLPAPVYIPPTPAPTDAPTPMPTPYPSQVNLVNPLQDFAGSVQDDGSILRVGRRELMEDRIKARGREGRIMRKMKEVKPGQARRRLRKSLRTMMMGFPDRPNSIPAFDDINLVTQPVTDPLPPPPPPVDPDDPNLPLTDEEDRR